MLKFFNTLTNKKETFQSIRPKHVNIYVCGVTVYDLCHIGHGRTFIVFDMIIRYFKFLGYTVHYVRNITDIDDKIIKKITEQEKDLFSFTNNLIQEMNLDFSSLNILPPDSEPLVTKSMHLIIKFIKKLLIKKHAYVSNNGDILFSIQKFREYGKLSNQKTNFLRSQALHCVSNKKNPLDFVVWKKHSILNATTMINRGKNIKEPLWASPWGCGRPGWHIECSAISDYYFSNNLDIHGGGIDLLFPHHENERSQSFCANGHEISKYWIHSGLLITNNKKMSKSLKNDLTIRKILKLYHPEIIRYYFLSTHYRKPLYFNGNSLMRSKISLEKIYEVLKNNDCNVNFSDNSLFFEEKFKKAMNDDFNTPKAISILFILAEKIRYYKSRNLYKQANELSSRLRYLGSVLGLFLEDPNIFLYSKYQHHLISIAKIEMLISIRNSLRQLSKWNKADAIRKKLFTIGIFLKDKKNETMWNFFR